MINKQKEWEFIVNETHKEKPNSKNLLKREKLFALQILLSKHDDSFYEQAYLKLKKLYS